MKKKLILFFVLIPIIIWVMALLKCDFLTLMYGEEFKTIYKEQTMIGDIDYLRILEYSSETARIYYVSKNKSSGNIVDFEKKNENWTFVEWATIWSDTGSASEMIWPYWWHFIYGGL